MKLRVLVESRYPARSVSGDESPNGLEGPDTWMCICAKSEQGLYRPLKEMGAELCLIAVHKVRTWPLAQRSRGIYLPSDLDEAQLFC